MFSIIIPTLNEHQIIAQAINQFDEVKNKYSIEVIVSDSGSIDNTVLIAKKYVDNVVIYDDKNCNISKARNLGAKNAKNKYLIFLDADILIKDIEVFFETIISEFNNKNLIAITPRISVYPDEETKIDQFIHLIMLLISNILNKVGIGYSRGGCQIIKSTYFNRIDGYNEKYVAAEDVDIFRRLRKLGKTKILNNLKVYESPRRYRKFGYINVLCSWFMNWAYTLLFKRSFSTKW